MPLNPEDAKIEDFDVKQNHIDEDPRTLSPEARAYAAKQMGISIEEVNALITKMGKVWDQIDPDN